MSKKLLISLAPLVGAIAFAVMPAAAQAATPHYWVNAKPLAAGAENRLPVVAYGHLKLTPAVEGAVPTECDNVTSGYIENPEGGGPGKTVTEGWAADNCSNTECAAAGGHIGVVFENEKELGLRNQLAWPGELTEKVSETIRLKSTNVAVYVHCQFAYTAPTEKPGSGGFTGLEERQTAEYNGGTKVTCTTGTGPGGTGSSEPSTSIKAVGGGTSTSKPGETTFNESGGELECSLFKGITSGKLASFGWNRENNSPVFVIATKSP